MLLMGILPGCGGGDSGGKQAWARPQNVPELAVKSVAPDGAQSWMNMEVPPAPPKSEAQLERGKTLFGQACAACHGASGKGDGVLTQRFDLGSRPADLAQPVAWIKLRTTLQESTGGGVPSASDLFRTLTRGLPGTAMGSYRELPAEDRWALVAYVRTLSASYAIASKSVEFPARIEHSAALLELGGAEFNLRCMTCHGRDGMGGAPMVDLDTGKPYRNIAFAAEGGSNTLGGRAPEDIARTLLAGLHSRSPMRTQKDAYFPSSLSLPEQKEIQARRFWGTVYYVNELMDQQRTKGK
jgi:mono/diheme cytochrome c family protein